MFHNQSLFAVLSIFFGNFRNPCIFDNQRTIVPENAHLKPDLGVLSHNEMTLTLNTQHTFIDFTSCLHLQSFRSQAAIVSKPSDF